ncbi:leucine aminopeptidase [Fomitiporia mediterranea MF3/22]|uniref:leucine aminopeptidase n=1 Tax=Fomitiporia mediterranea (strain MF3/22) TaxID=694068 RepID=UPI0004407FE1|nr:leucine aminopeptidase [Fomitiporia mediterranea MF3/22]EJD02539.1 leucine aminopeptidase [Fomitiporia mediterranea MF3/22]
MSTSPDAYLSFVHPDQSTSQKENSKAAHRLWSTSRTSDSTKPLDSRLIFGDDNSIKSIVSLGDSSSFSKKPLHARREVIRKAAGKGITNIRDVALSAGVKTVQVDAGGDPADVHAAAVGAKLGLHAFTLKTGKDMNPGKDITLLPSQSSDTDAWTRGTVYAEAQILARELMELPGNMMTPTLFCERIKKEAEGLENLEIIVRDQEWIREKGMRSFLSVAKGSSEPPKLLEIHYKGTSVDSTSQPLAFVGKGITFDSGGISLKPGPGMKLMRGDMGGAATVCAATLGLARLKVPINVVTVVALCENMPGPSANKPGDIVYAMNGKSIEIDNTDAEGRLILADALHYTSTTFNVHTLVDVATLTGAMEVGLGNVYSGVFSTSESLWTELNTAGTHEHDLFWRMPLSSLYSPQITGSNADLCNTGGKPGGCCTAALFLRSFVDGIADEDGGSESEMEGKTESGKLRWAHIDIAGSMEATRSEPYQYKGMTGRPTRALIEFAHWMTQK